MAETTKYVTKENERWDNVAHRAYGRASLFAGIIEANPNVPITTTLPAGTVLIIPIIEEQQTKTDKELLPPWKL